jgi:nitrite reductase/ring-hydroxylating ferredoxin subunit
VIQQSLHRLLRVRTTRESPPEAYSASLPTPAGWYCVGTVDEFGAGAVTTRRLAGRDIVVFHTKDGQLAALDAHCPHLGAHMGNGGRVEGDTLRCPFHGFCFDANGTCKRAYGGRAPRTARARAYPVMTLDGLALIYFHPEDAAPRWQPRAPDMGGWSPYRIDRWTLRGHPQETTENAVDIGHFAVVHGYTDVRERGQTCFTGPHLVAEYDFKRPASPLFAPSGAFREAIEVHAWGLGYSRVHVTDLSWGLDVRLLVLSTPLDAGHIELRLGLSVRDFSRSPRVSARLRFVPRAVTDGLLGRALLHVYRREVEQDCAVWAHKRYVERPALAAGDGPVGLYRRWAKQFYAKGDTAA